MKTRDPTPPPGSDAASDEASDAAAAAVTPDPFVARLLGQIKGALSVWVRDLEVEHGERSSALSFVHPVHGATIMVVVDAGEGDPEEEGATPASVGAFVILGDFDGIADDRDAIFRTFALNASLMSCAVGLVRLNADEVVTALCRRLPAASVDVAEIRDMIDAMIWEYAQAAGFLADDAPAAAPAEA